MSQFVEDLATWVAEQAPEAHRRGANAVLFIAARADIEAAREAGFAAKTIWEYLHATGRIPYTYRTFLRHIQWYIDEPSAMAAVTPASPEGPFKQAPQSLKPPRKSPLAGFVMRPPCREDLV